jgi:hypothetical protein
MNIAQLSEQLKDVPQNRLIDYAQNPNSVVPQFLALAEIQRRQHLSAQAQPPAATVAEDVLAQAQPQMQQQMPQQMAPQQAPQQMAQQLPENQPGVAQLPTGMPQGMASGGIVAFAKGDLVDDDEDDEDIQDQRHNNQMMSLIAGLRTRAKDAAAAVPRAVESVRAALPQSYERAKAAASAVPETVEGGIEGFLSKIQRLESGGRHYDAKGNILTSPKGAEGIMQVMRHTQKDPGFGVTPARDRSPEELERVGKEYGIAMLKEFGDPKLAAMAYNWGPGNVKKWLASGQQTPIPAETKKYASHFSQGGIASFSGNKGSDVEEDEDYSTPYLDRSRNLVSGVRSLYDTITTPKNYDLYDMYKSNIGDPFARYANKVVDSFNETPEEQASRFRSYSMTPKAEPKVGYTEPLGVNVQAPASPKVSEALQMTPGERNRYAAINAANMAAKTNVPVADTTSPTDQDFRNFDQAAALFQAEQQVKNLQNPPEQAGPQEVDPYKAALLRAAQEREDIKAGAQTDKYLAMLQASLGMMAGTSPYAMANIGQGGMQGVAAYAAAKKQRAAELSDLSKYEARVMNAKETSEIKRAQLASLEDARQETARINRDRLDLKASDSADISSRKRLELINRAQQDAASDPEYKAIVKIRDQLPEDDPKRKQYEDFLESIKRSYIATAETGKYVPPVRPVFAAPVKEPSLWDRITGKGSPAAPATNMPAPPPGFKVQ